MTELSNLRAPKGSKRERKRIGRGQGSGWGKTAGRGGKGQKARSGNMNFEGFEGGQMPLQRRLPKFGFTNPSRRQFAVVNLETLERFQAGETVDVESLEARGLLKARRGGLKILGSGALSKALTVRAHRFSVSAKAAIEKAGGKVEMLADKQLKLPARGEGIKKRLAKARAARRVAKKKG